MHKKAGKAVYIREIGERVSGRKSKVRKRGRRKKRKGEEELEKVGRTK